MNRIKYILIVTALLGSCKTTEFGFKVIDVSGMVYDFNNPQDLIIIARAANNYGLKDFALYIKDKISSIMKV